MITKEENIILEMLLKKKNSVLEKKQQQRKESYKETYNRLLKRVNESEALRIAKSSLK